MKSALADTQNAFPGFAWTATPDGEIHSFNRRWCDYTGQHLEESSESRWLACVHPDHTERVEEAWKRFDELQPWWGSP